jgi:hypothetical protein
MKTIKELTEKLKKIERYIQTPDGKAWFREIMQEMECSRQKKYWIKNSLFHAPKMYMRWLRLLLIVIREWDSLEKNKKIMLRGK